jgi:hypothetical protein
MQMVSCIEAQSILPALLNRARHEDILIRSGDAMFRLLPVRESGVKKSPFDGVKCLKTAISTQEIVEVIRESRAGK